MKILLVDDSKLQRVVVQRILTKAGYEVILAADGEEGLQLARQNSPDLILLDMMLPRLDGVGVLEALKKDLKMAHIPVIVMTGLSQRNEEKLKSAGAASFYQKSELGVEKGVDALLHLVGHVYKEFGKSGPGAALN